ncbi:MAG: methyltransferase [Polyangiaceae bacterium]|nr:methyltransferase [Polyangiaceae bacterium]
MTGLDPAQSLGATLDRLSGVTLWQPNTGHRTTIDTLLLARFAARGRHPRSVLDLGCGAGAAALVLQHSGVGEDFVLWDNDEAACALARLNAERSGLAAEIVQRDVASGIGDEFAGRFDLVVMNPPYFEPGSARPPRQAPGAAIGALAPFLTLARDALARRGRVCVCYPARSLPELLSHAARVGLLAKRLRLVHAYADRDARLALTEFKPGRPGGLCVEPPLVEWRSAGVPSAELAELSAPRAVDRAESPPPPAR